MIRLRTKEVPDVIGQQEVFPLMCAFFAAFILFVC